MAMATQTSPNPIGLGGAALEDLAEQAVEIEYTNYRGESALRRVVPMRIWFGESEWHKGPQWFMDALDLDRQAERSFAMADVHRWEQIGTKANVRVG
jgi:predicted DNA-binding transcriptional regulator YafY